MKKAPIITSTVEPRQHLKNVRKSMGMKQEEFAELFMLSVDCYRKYELGDRNLTDNVYRMMLRILEYHKKGVMIDNFSVFLEEMRRECLTNIFCLEKHETVNMIFDYLIRKVNQMMK